MNTWFLIYCKPKQDIRAEQNLIRQGFDVFRPTVNIITPKAGLASYITCESLFPRYVFLRVDPELKSIAPVLSTYGVANFVKFGNQYATAPESLIEEIKTNVGKHIIEDNSHIRTGDPIFVDGHGFDRVKAIYCNACGHKRAMILMNILGNDVKLMVPTECIQKIREG